jgi:leucyl/phenylalanyl-tRNA--protein transferase
VKIPFLPAAAGPEVLPGAEAALAEPNGLLAAGGALSSDWLLHAYRHGVFPWYSRNEPILWWSPNPRCVLVPQEFHRSRSLARSARRAGLSHEWDRDFAGVLAGCAAPRSGQDGTWLTPAMRRAYLALHREGFAHSLEVYRDGLLAGGVYGVRLGGVFFGESMFSRVRDASKLALLHLAEWAPGAGVALIDCQMPTPHLMTLGARTLPRREFLARLRELIATPAR